MLVVVANKLAFAEFSPKQAKKLLGAEIGTQLPDLTFGSGCSRIGATAPFLTTQHGRKRT